MIHTVIFKRHIGVYAQGRADKQWMMCETFCHF